MVTSRLRAREFESQPGPRIHEKHVCGRKVKVHTHS
jgi:hypothetical protein